MPVSGGRDGPVVAPPPLVRVEPEEGSVTELFVLESVANNMLEYTRTSRRVFMADKLNFGVIGAGGIARRKTIPGMLQARNCRLAAAMDPVGVREIAAAFKVSKAYATEAEILSDPEIEAVYIASPANCHLKQIRMAAEAGKHVLCEKPLTLNARQAKEAVDACRRNRVFLQEGYMMKFHCAHQAI